MRDEDEQLVNCQQAIRDSLAATLDTCRPGLASKYGISEDSVHHAIGWAAISVAIDNYMPAGEFSEDPRRDMQIHINYLIHGAVAFTRYFPKDGRD